MADEQAAVEKAAAERQVAEHEAAIAKLRLERAQAEREAAKLARPWWRNWNVTALGAFIAAMAPVTTGVSGYFEKQKQLALEEQKQRHEIVMAEQKQDEDIRAHYLDRILDPLQSRRTLRLLIATSTDEKFRQWASEERSFVDLEEVREKEEVASLTARADKDEELLRQTLSSVELAKHLAESVAEYRKRAAAFKPPSPKPPEHGIWFHHLVTP